MVFVAGKTISAQQITQSPKKDHLPISRDSAMKDYVSMQAGQMILIQNDKVSRMKKDMAMKNGTIVMANGTVKTKEGHSFQLKEGDRVYMNGLIEGPSKSPIY